MKQGKLIALMLSVATMTGCAGSVESPKSVADASQIKKEQAKEPDTFDKVGTTLGVAVAISSKFVWDEAKKTWAWIDSQEHEAELKKAYESLKSTASSAWQSGKETLIK